MYMTWNQQKRVNPLLQHAIHAMRLLRFNFIGEWMFYFYVHERLNVRGNKKIDNICSNKIWFFRNILRWKKKEVNACWIRINLIDSNCEQFWEFKKKLKLKISKRALWNVLFRVPWKGGKKSIYKVQAITVSSKSYTVFCDYFPPNYLY